MRPSQIKDVPKSELIWALYHISEDDRETMDVVQSYIEYLIAAINPQLYSKIQEKKNAEEIESAFFDEELKRLKISKQDFDALENADSAANYDEGLDIIGNPIVPGN